MRTIGEGRKAYWLKFFRRFSQTIGERLHEVAHRFCELVMNGVLSEGVREPCISAVALSGTQRNRRNQ